MAAFPLAPRYGKMLALSHQHSLLPFTVALVAALTVPEVLIETPIDSKENVNGKEYSRCVPVCNWKNEVKVVICYGQTFPIIRLHA